MVEGVQTVKMSNLAQWGPIWAGLVTALTVFLLLAMFLYWIGALTVVPRPGGAVVGGPNNGWITALLAVISFFVGGWLATSSTSVRYAGSGLLNGFLVWALGIVLISAFSAAGLGTIFGAAGNAIGYFMALGHTIPQGDVNAAQVVAATRAAAGWGFLFVIVSAIAAAIGGTIGERSGPTGPTTMTPA
jgi:hypothetical protein